MRRRRGTRSSPPLRQSGRARSRRERARATRSARPRSRPAVPATSRRSRCASSRAAGPTPPDRGPRARRRRAGRRGIGAAAARRTRRVRAGRARGARSSSPVPACAATSRRIVFAPTSMTPTRMAGISRRRTGRTNLDLMRPTCWPGAGGRGRARSASALSASNGSVRPFAAGRVRQRPSPSRSHASALSASSTSKTRAISCCARASSTGATTSTRLSRFRGIRSALPIRTVGRVAATRRRRAGCARGTDRERCEHESSRSCRQRRAGASRCFARRSRSRAPSCEAAYSASMTRGSVSALTLIRIAPVLAVLRDRADVLDQAARAGRTARRGSCGSRAAARSR